MSCKIFWFCETRILTPLVVDICSYREQVRKHVIYKINDMYKKTKNKHNKKSKNKQTTKSTIKITCECWPFHESNLAVFCNGSCCPKLSHNSFWIDVLLMLSNQIVIIMCCILSLSSSIRLIRVITKLPNSEQSDKGKVNTHNYINRQNQSTIGKLWKP